VSRPERVDRLARRIAESHNETLASPNFASYLEEAEALAKRDEEQAADEYGQRLREVYQWCDLFVSSSTSLFPQIDRFVRLILGDISETPRADEQLMFQAHAASLFSGSRGRQAGAVLASPAHEVLGIGWNGVPKGGGGLYRAGEHYDRRDGLELDRTTHAEMEAVLAAARIGVSPRNATLYTTTFPCDSCARLIVTSGVRRVVYVEPYPQSRALELHRDSIQGFDELTSPECGKRNCDDPHAVRFEPFDGIAPHRFQDLFSATRGVEMLPLSYLDLEAKALYDLKNLLESQPDPP
jgi:deoxycytidylate deaminase